jgi:hypothetical protein
MNAQISSNYPAQYKRTLFAELLLITELQLIILLARWATDADAALLLDGALMLIGILATAFALVRRVRGWFLLCGILPIIAGLTQILLSFGIELALLASFSVLLLADMVANLVLLAVTLWKGRDGRGTGMPG